MYDRQTESWWQEFGGEGVIGQYAGTKLEQLYLSIVSWADFKAAHPDGQALSRPDSGRAYGQNPYAGYDRPGSEPFLFRGEKDPRLPAVERVVAIERDGDAWAVSFTTLAEERVVSASIAGEDIVVFWAPGAASALGLGFHRIGSRRGRCRDILAAGSRRQRVDLRAGCRWPHRGPADREPVGHFRPSNQWVAGGRTTDPGAGAHRTAVVLVGGVPTGYGGVPRNAVGADDYPPLPTRCGATREISRARSAACGARSPTWIPPGCPPPSQSKSPACGTW